VKLQQLRYLVEISRNDFSVSATARRLHTSQPGVSKQILALEDELGVTLFTRHGKQITGLSVPGREILALAEQVLHTTGNIRDLAQEYADPKRGRLSIATTHTQSRYVLPPVIREFIGRYPEVNLNLQQGTPIQIAEMAARGMVDFAIATEAMELFSDLIMLPCYRWNRCILVPDGHPLLELDRPVALEDVAAWPLVTYVFGFTGRSQLDEAFRHKGLTPNVVFTAADADVIKTYVRLGLGIGIVASMAYDEEEDRGLRSLDASHLFDYSTTRIGFRRNTVLRSYMRDFIQLFASQLDAPLLDRLLECRTQSEVDALLQDQIVPVW
jgi:LysR family cys regulon transcriptional activator